MAVISQHICSLHRRLQILCSRYMCEDSRCAVLMRCGHAGCGDRNEPAGLRRSRRCFHPAQILEMKGDEAEDSMAVNCDRDPTRCRGAGDEGCVVVRGWSSRALRNKDPSALAQAVTFGRCHRRADPVIGDLTRFPEKRRALEFTGPVRGATVRIIAATAKASLCSAGSHCTMYLPLYFPCASTRAPSSCSVHS